MIQIDVLSTFRGHLPIYVEDPTDGAQRVKLAEHVTSMMKDGYDLFLIDEDRITRRISGYDAESNEWVLFSRKVTTPNPPVPEAEAVLPTTKRGPGRPRNSERVTAEGTTAAAVARTAGG
ncbi:MAG: hypothetical protein WAX80_00290 [Minisyncoccia bacterium]